MEKTKQSSGNCCRMNNNNTLGFLLLFSVLFLCVGCIRVSSKIDSLPENEERNEREKTDDKEPRLVRAYYEVDFDKENNPLTINCNQPGVICKLPSALPADGGLKAVRRHVTVVNNDDTVPIIKGVIKKVDGKLNNDDTEKTTDRVVLLVAKGDTKTEESGPPVYKGTIDDIEAVLSDIKDPDTISYLSKGYLHKPYDYRPLNHGFVSIYNNRLPLPYDYLDYGRGVNPNTIPLSIPYGWTPWLRPAETQLRRGVSPTPPCQTTVYNCNPCSCAPAGGGTKPSLATSHKPSINIDDKIDRD